MGGRLRRSGPAAVLLLALGGCFRHPGLPPLPPDVLRAGLTQEDYALRRSFAAARFDEAVALVSGKGRFAPEDELLASLYRASALYYAGRFDTSGVTLDRAAILADERFTKSVSRNLLATITNDGVLPYEPSQTERLMMNYYGMLDFLRRGDAEGAAVEARRISALLESFDSRKDSVDIRTRALLNYLAGASFEAAGEKADAEVSYRVARALVGDSALPFPAAAKRRPRPRAGTRATTAPAPAVPTGELIVVVEHGYVAHRVPRLMLVPVTEEEFDKFGGKPEETLAAVTAISARALAWIALRQDHVTWRDDDDDRELRMDDDRVSVAYLLPVAWTSLQRPYHPAWRGSLLVDATIRQPFAVNADLCDAVANDFRRSRPAAFARGVIRAGAKLALARAAVSKAEDRKGEIAGTVTRWATDALAIATERADIRQWRLLPGELSVMRLSLPAGTHDLTIEYAPRPGEAARLVPLGRVEVAPGRIAFATTRLWEDGVTDRVRAVVAGTAAR
ncbi:MAG TPA: hypothetical protein VHM30_13025 [Gemmatimonadaceae bacterium]|nr:hypothetical protein [Gemmatimonadaceae bacterium]